MAPGAILDNARGRNVDSGQSHLYFCNRFARAHLIIGYIERVRAATVEGGFRENNNQPSGLALAVCWLQLLTASDMKGVR